MPLADIPDLIPVLPEVFMAVAIMVLLMFGVFQPGGTADQDVRSLRLIWALSIVVLVLALVLVAVLSGDRVMAFGNLYISDAFAVFCKILVLLGSVMTMTISRGFLERQGMARFEYPILVVFATLGMMMMVSANDLISLYLGLEMQSLSLYVIAAFQRDDERSTEAGLKYFVLGALASGFLLYGSSLIYGFSGTTNFDQLAALFDYASQAGPGTGVIFGIVFIMAGLAFKVSAVPFHMWLPDVYQGARTPVGLYIASAPKLAALALIMRILVDGFGDLHEVWQGMVMVLGVLSLLVGNIVAIAQTNIKRMLFGPSGFLTFHPFFTKYRKGSFMTRGTFALLVTLVLQRIDSTLNLFPSFLPKFTSSG